METILSETLGDVLAFRDARDWKQSHTPKDLPVSVSLETAELLEVLQWLGEGRSHLTLRSQQLAVEATGGNLGGACEQQTEGSEVI
jgi:NTP pyrophosphatase (non-canonical NTP hydrolase)